MKHEDLSARTIDVLSEVILADRWVTIDEVVPYTGQNKKQVTRRLSVLHEQGYVERKRTLPGRKYMYRPTTKAYDYWATGGN